MKAFRLVRPHTTDVVDIATPEPGPGEVLVRVGAAGACHSDLHILDAPDGAFPLPMTLGHETAGWVEVLGAGVSGWSPREAVAIYGIIGCGRCSACLRGRDNECHTRPVGGIGISRDGGMAEYVSVPAGQLLPIGDLDVTQAAPLTDAALTPYHAIARSRDALRPGTTCVVIGVGGLGHMAIQILAATTAVRIVAVDVNDQALALARRVGAHEVVRSDSEAVPAIRNLVGPPPDGAEVVFDFVAVDSTLAIGAAVVAAGGRFMIVGLGGGRLTLAPGVGNIGVPMETAVMVPFWGTRAELAEVLGLARQGRIAAHVETFPLDRAPEAYERLRAGGVHGRAVITPGLPDNRAGSAGPAATAS
jgi:propanol-preferring alcohol dehydrogenase